VAIKAAKAIRLAREWALPHGLIHCPAFLPDGTRGVVRGLAAQDLEECQIQALQMNAFHLLQRPGASTVRALGGLHQMSGWQRPIFTDSGGFQIYSLIRQDPERGAISERGARFEIRGGARKYNLTPEKSVQLQMAFGADVVICLDDCTHAAAPEAEQALSVQRTVAWARRCRQEFDRQLDQRRIGADHRPQLLAVVQGGASRELRRLCAEKLLSIGFDAYGFGGWPLDEQGELLVETLAFVRELLPAEYPLHGLGIGHPENIRQAVALGYDIFDSTLPTRDARHGRLYTFTRDPAEPLPASGWLSTCYVQDARHTRAGRPLSAYCDALCCRRYSLGYLHHLFRLDDALYTRLATLHNLRFMTQLMANLRTWPP
jgi:queuine tRNA-ribosyltransferase